MKRPTQLALIAATALAALGAVSGSAPATTIVPANTPVTLASTNGSLAVSGGGTISCTAVSVTGTTPATGGTTWVAVGNGTVTFSGCTAFVLPATVTLSEACNTPATSAKLDIMSTSATTATAVLTTSVGCTIDANIPAIGCTLTGTGGQTLGNGTTGPGGGAWTNASPKSSGVLNSVAVANIHSSGGGFGCPTAGLHTGTLTGNFAVTSATNVTVTP